eukprot:761771-Hanusia_phi.AAC.1
MDIPGDLKDDLLVCKYGETCSLERRLSQHKNDFGQYKNVDLKVKFFSYIDAEYTKQAENDAKEYLKEEGHVLDFKKYKELIVLNKSRFRTIKLFYNELSDKYGGNMKCYQQKIETLQYQLEEQQKFHEKELKLCEERHQHEMRKKEQELIMESERHEHELKEKEQEMIIQ